MQKSGGISSAAAASASAESEQLPRSADAAGDADAAAAAAVTAAGAPAAALARVAGDAVPRAAAPGTTGAWEVGRVGGHVQGCSCHHNPALTSGQSGLLGPWGQGGWGPPPPPFDWPAATPAGAAA